MLKLVVNKGIETEGFLTGAENATTCLNCSFYDALTDECGIYSSLQLNNKTAENCKSYALIPTLEEMGYSFERIEEDDEFTGEDEGDFYYSFQGERKGYNVEYPEKPAQPSMYHGAVWYKSPCGTYGCWLINKRGLGLVPKTSPPIGIKSYSSPVPLHDHQSSDGLLSNICWYVDESGMGRYALLVNGQIKMF